MVAMKLTWVRTNRKQGPPVEVKNPNSSSYGEIAEIGSRKLGIDLPHS